MQCQYIQVWWCEMLFVKFCFIQIQDAHTHTRDIRVSLCLNWPRAFFSYHFSFICCYYEIYERDRINGRNESVNKWMHLTNDVVVVVIIIAAVAHVMNIKIVNFLDYMSVLTKIGQQFLWCKFWMKYELFLYKCSKTWFTTPFLCFVTLVIYFSSKLWWFAKFQ